MCIRDRLCGGPDAPAGLTKGYYVQPTVFGRVRPGSTIEQEEIFGPVLAIIPVDGFDEALAVANDTLYGLTGAVYSTSIDRIDRAKREYHAGNLYLNRGCTGALVGVHPFGGFNLSGTDSKAGGPDYLMNFTQGKTCLLYTSPSPRDRTRSRMPSSA